MPSSHTTGFPVLVRSHVTLSPATGFSVPIRSKLTVSLSATGFTVLVDRSFLVYLDWLGAAACLLLHHVSNPFADLSLRVTVGAGRGDSYALLYNTSCVFLDTTLSILSGGRVSWRMIALDLILYQSSTPHPGALSIFACKKQFWAWSGGTLFAREDAMQWDPRL